LETTRKGSVALRCPVCRAPAELRAVLTDTGFAVARAMLIDHLEHAHGVAPDDAEKQVDGLRWEHVESSGTDGE
jgi:hypothetical protein